MEDERGSAQGDEDEDAENEGDADETKYCFCDGPSYGEMVGCDGERCEREWFHLECVGLKVAPKSDGEFFSFFSSSSLVLHLSSRYICTYH